MMSRSRIESPEKELLQSLIKMENGKGSAHDRANEMRLMLDSHYPNSGLIIQLHSLHTACEHPDSRASRRRIFKLLLVDRLVTLQPNNLQFLSSKETDLISIIIDNLNADITDTSQRAQITSLGDLLCILIQELSLDNTPLLNAMLAQFEQVLESPRVPENARIYLALILTHSIYMIRVLGPSSPDRLRKYQQMYEILDSFSKGLGVRIHELDLKQLNESCRLLDAVTYTGPSMRMEPVRMESIFLQTVIYFFNDVKDLKSTNNYHEIIYPLLSKILNNKENYHQFSCYDSLHLALLFPYPYLDRDMFCRIVFAIFNNTNYVTIKHLKGCLTTILARKNLSNSPDGLGDLCQAISSNDFLREHFEEEQINTTICRMREIFNYRPQCYLFFSPMVIILFSSTAGIFLASLLSNQLPFSIGKNLILGAVSGLAVGIFAVVKESNLNAEREKNILATHSPLTITV